MKQQERKPFEVREYGRTELAQVYSPHISPEAAWRKLKRWIAYYPGLVQQLEAVGYHASQRTFTPEQVKLIVGAVGEP